MKILFGPFNTSAVRFFALSLLLFGCSSIAAAADHIYVLQNSIWRQQNIVVCWEQFDEQFAAERVWVQDQIANSWQRHSSLLFTGWGRCAEEPGAMLRLRVADENPRVLALGIQLLGREGGVVLNFTFANFSTNFCRANVAGRREHCIRVTAMHEFGHAIGFAHEQNRADAPDWCLNEAQGNNGDLMITDFDSLSVMNYCNSSSWPAVADLSQLDIVGLQRIYGAPGGALPQNVTAFATNLSSQHPDCKKISDSRSPMCVSAIHRVCAAAGRGAGGLSQEVNYAKGVFGVGCFAPSAWRLVSISDLKAQHPLCKSPVVSQADVCVSAASRWCKAQGLGDAGLAQELAPTHFDIACIRVASYDITTQADLQSYHGSCNNKIGNTDEVCVSAAHRWCIAKKKGQIGLPIERNAGKVGIACFTGTWYGEVAIR